MAKAPGTFILKQFVKIVNVDLYKFGLRQVVEQVPSFTSILNTINFGRHFRIKKIITETCALKMQQTSSTYAR